MKKAMYPYPPKTKLFTSKIFAFDVTKYLHFREAASVQECYRLKLQELIYLL